VAGVGADAGALTGRAGRTGRALRSGRALRPRIGLRHVQAAVRPLLQRVTRVGRDAGALTRRARWALGTGRAFGSGTASAEDHGRAAVVTAHEASPMSHGMRRLR